MARAGVISKVFFTYVSDSGVRKTQEAGALGVFLSLSLSPGVTLPRGSCRWCRLFRFRLGYHAAAALLLHFTQHGSPKGPAGSKRRVMDSTSYERRAKEFDASKSSCALTCSFFPSHTVHFYQCNRCHQFLVKQDYLVC